MKVKDILPDHPLEKIMVRVADKGADILIGFCHWTGSELISLDGDSYQLDDEIEKYEFDEEGNLTYWETCDRTEVCSHVYFSR